MTNITSSSIKRVRLIGAPHSALAFELRDFLSRSVVAYDWVELDERSVQALPNVNGLADRSLPICEFPDGSRLLGATVSGVAKRLGWIEAPRLNQYDVSIFGAGPAGLSAAVYAASEGLRTVLVERDAIGGQAGNSSLIENYLGFPEGIGGADLAERARQQAVRFGVEILRLRHGMSTSFVNGGIRVDLVDGSKVQARTNICATGISWRRLGLSNEDRLVGTGIFYGAGSSEAPMCKGRIVYIVGGGNSAGQAAVHLSMYANEVVMLIRGRQLADTLSDYLIRKVQSTPSIRVVTNCEVIAVDGNDCLECISVRDRTTEKVATLSAQHLFVCIGGQPNTNWARDTSIVRDACGYIVTGADLMVGSNRYQDWPLDRPPFHLETSVPGSFAVGDVRRGSIKRVASAVGEGAMAIAYVHRHLSLV